MLRVLRSVNALQVVHVCTPGYARVPDEKCTSNAAFWWHISLDLQPQRAASLPAMVQHDQNWSNTKHDRLNQPVHSAIASLLQIILCKRQSVCATHKFVLRWVTDLFEFIFLRITQPINDLTEHNKYAQVRTGTYHACTHIHACTRSSMFARARTYARYMSKHCRTFFLAVFSSMPTAMSESCPQYFLIAKLYLVWVMSCQ